MGWVFLIYYLCVISKILKTYIFNGMSYTDYLISIRQLSIINEYNYENNIKKPSFTGNFYFKGLISNFYNKSYTCKQSHKILRYIQWLIINVKKKPRNKRKNLFLSKCVHLFKDVYLSHIYILIDYY